LAKTNYSFERRQRDLAKKRKQEEKRLRKLAARAESGGQQPGDAAPGDAPPEAVAPGDTPVPPKAEG